MVSSLVFLYQFAINYRSNFVCGDSKYYIFQDVEGPDIITNAENDEFRFDSFPSIFYRDIEKRYPYRVYIKYNNSKYVNYIGTDSSIEKQIVNLKACYPDGKFSDESIPSKTI
jgi:hypothetical protein